MCPKCTACHVQDNAASKLKAAKKLGPRAYASSQIIQAVEEGKSVNEVLDLAEDVAPEKISRVKDKVKKSMNPMGHSFDALAKYKATRDKLDKFLIYKAQNGSLSAGCLMSLRLVNPSSRWLLTWTEMQKIF